MTEHPSHPPLRLWPLLRGPLLVFLAGLLIFGAVSGERLVSHSRDNHYVYLADGLLHGRLYIEGQPPHLNDWAKFEGRWFVSFPPAPAVLMLPLAAVFGLQLNDRLFTLPFAAACPALLLLLLELLAARGRLDRRPWELLTLTALYGLGTVFFFAAVQGTVWYTAHMVGSTFLLLFLIAALEGRHPWLAGLCLGLAFACRPPVLLAGLFFILESLAVHAPADASSVKAWLRGSLVRAGGVQLIKQLVAFAVPVAVVIALLMLLNVVRFGDPLEFGHKYLQVRWSERIARYGLFHYHFLSRNLAAMLTLLPWWTDAPPHLGISRHGLALWFTSPALLLALWPKRANALFTAAALTALLIAMPDLLYQNTGWVQFGYRFALDFMPLLLLMLALSGRRFGRLFFALCAFSLAVNLFGAITFDRHWAFYPAASTTNFFQAD